MTKFTCLNCGYEFNGPIYLDSIGTHTVCPQCESSFDINITSKDIKNLWDEFGDVSMDQETECIEETWREFPSGTFREDIWHWFEDTFNVSIANLMHGE